MSKTLQVFLFLVISVKGLCQFNLPSQPVAPTTASLLQNSQYPVAKNTGVPQIQIDLYTITSGNLSLPITLSYHAGGIKVQQEASWVGLGWALNAGGVIGRSIRDRDDIDGPGVGYFGSPTLPADYSGEWFPAGVATSGTEVAYMKSILRGQYDCEPDMFNYSFCGSSGKFIFEKQTTSGILIGTDLNQKNNLKIEYLLNDKKFIITDGNGNKYYFGTKEYSYTDTKNASELSGSIIEDMSFVNDCEDEKSITSWQLDKIKSSNGEDSIVFVYSVPDSTSCNGLISQTSLMETFYERKTSSGSEFANNIPVTRSDSYVSKSLTQAADLTSIIFKNGHLDFNCSARDDLTGEGSPKLDTIKIYGNQGSSELKTISFEYDYFNGPNPSSGRLKLNKVFRGGGQFQFTYNESVTLPDKKSKSVDFWGFYNGQINNRLIPKLGLGNIFNLLYEDGANRYANPQTVQAGILTEIKYPTGGFTKFDFECNDIPGRTPIYSPLQKTVESNFAYYQMSNNQYAQQTFYVHDTTWMTISAYGICEKNCNQIPGLPEPDEVFALLVKVPDSTSYLDYDNVDQYYSGDIVSQFSYGECENNILQPSASEQIKIYPGWYRMISQTRIYQSFTSIAVNYNKVIGYKLFEEVGGLRVKRITTDDGNGTINTTRYSYRYSSDTAQSTGVLISFPKHSFQTTVVYPDDLSDQFKIVQSTSLNPISISAQGGYVGYNQVTELFGENGENGKLVSYYGNGAYQSTPYVPPTEINLNGHLLKEETYNANGDILNKMENFYGEYGPAYKDILGMTHTTYPFLYEFSSSFIADCPYDPPMTHLYAEQDLALSYLINYYPIIVDWWRLDRTENTNYSITGNLKDTTFYTYNPLNRQIATKSQTTSDKSRFVTKYKYATDYSSTAGSIYSSMVSRNMINYPIETQTWRQRLGVESLVRSNITEFKFFAGGKFISPHKSHTLKITSPIPSSSVGESIGSMGPYHNIFFNSSSFEQDTEVDYDNEGRVKQVISVDGIVKSYVWGYENTYVVAEVIGKPHSTVLGVLNQSILQNPTSDAALRTELDKIRQNFPSAFVTTCTYKPLIGMSSSTDTNNRISYYEYDDLGRLKLIRDQNQNILKKYDYKFAIQ